MIALARLEERESIPLARLLPALLGGCAAGVAMFDEARRSVDVRAGIAGLLTDPAQEDAALVGLAPELGLTLAEVLSVGLARLVELDPLTARAVAAFSGGARPTLGLLATVLREADPDGAEVLALATGAAVGCGLLEVLQPDLPLAERPVRLPSVLIPALAGVAARPERCEILATATELPASMAAKIARWAEAAAGAGPCCLVLRGGDPADRRLLAASLAVALGGPSAGAALAIGADAPRTGLGVLCRLTAMVPIDEMELGPGERRRLPDLQGHDGVRLVLTGPDGHIDAGRLPMTDLAMPVPTIAERAVLWREALGESAGGLDAQLLGPGRIAAIGRRVQLATDDTACTAEAVRAASLAELRGELAPLALPVPEAVTDDAMVLPPGLREALHLLLARCRQREVLGAGLGPAARAGTGVRALLTGPPGTGKTLACAWLATQLGMPLFRVDLAGVMSKWIGETEKNLAGLLARAETSEAVLLFDEADSLFGARTEVRESSDRFANNQTNYLLARIETYGGIVLLTSNSQQRFDPAFARRLDMILEVPLPGPRERRELWRAHLGTDQALTVAETNRLAAAGEIAGGHIRNIVLTASVLARANARQITMEDIRHGFDIEYRKLGRSVPPELTQPA
jgi:hypothetical protein